MSEQIHQDSSVPEQAPPAAGISSEAEAVQPEIQRQGLATLGEQLKAKEVTPEQKFWQGVTRAQSLRELADAIRGSGYSLPVNDDEEYVPDELAGYIEELAEAVNEGPDASKALGEKILAIESPEVRRKVIELFGTKSSTDFVDLLKKELEAIPADKMISFTEQPKTEAPVFHELPDVHKGDVFVDTVTGNEIEITGVFRDPAEPDGGHYLVKTEDLGGEASEQKLSAAALDKRLTNLVKQQRLSDQPVTNADEEAYRRHKEEAIEQVSVGDSFVDTKTGERIELYAWVEDANHPEGGYYKARRTSKSGKVYEYPFPKSLISATQNDANYTFEKGKQRGPDLGELLKTAPADLPKDKKGRNRLAKAMEKRYNGDPQPKNGIDEADVVARKKPVAETMPTVDQAGFADLLTTDERNALGTQDDSKPGTENSFTPETPAQEPEAVHAGVESGPATDEAKIERLKQIQIWDHIRFSNGTEGRVLADGLDTAAGPAFLFTIRKDGVVQTLTISVADLVAHAALVVSIESGTQEDFNKDFLEEESGTAEAEAAPETTPTPDAANAEASAQAEAAPGPTDAQQAEHAYTPEWLATGFGEFNVSEAELKKIPGYEELSEGQRMLLLENFRQLALGSIERQAADIQKQETADAGFWGKIKRAFVKSYYTGKAEKTAYETVTAGGMAQHEATLTALVNSLHRSPDVEVRNGRLEFQYFSTTDFAPELRAAADPLAHEFNTAASEFSRMPVHWSYDSATPSEQKQFREAEYRYELAKESILDLKAKSSGLSESIRAMSIAENSIRTNQYFNEHPDVAKELMRIKDENVWMRALKRTGFERGAYLVAGGVGRLALAGTLGIMAAPAVASLSGAIRAGKRAEETLRERDRKALAGIDDSSEEAMSFMKADKKLQKKNGPDAGADRNVGALGKIEAMVRKVQSTENPDPALMQRLWNRIAYTEWQLARGTIDFGQGSERIYNQYALLDRLGAARSVFEMRRCAIEDMESTVFSGVDREMMRLTGMRTEQINQKRNRYIRREIAKGAAIAATAAFVGARISQGVMDAFGSDASSEAPVRAGADASEMPVPKGAEAPASAMAAAEAKQAADDILDDAHIPAAEAPAAVSTAQVAEPSLSRDVITGKGLGDAALSHGTSAPAETAPTSVETAPAAAPLPEAPKNVAAGVLDVQINEGESMIASVGRTFEERYGLSHERAMQLANRVWAEHDPQQWYNRVHAGDHFQIELRDVGAEELRTGEIGEIAKRMEYEPADFKADSGFKPAHDLPTKPHTEAPPVAPETSPVSEVPPLAEQLQKQVVSPEALAFLQQHKVQFDSNTMELSYDLNDDGTFSKALMEAGSDQQVSMKTEVFKLGAHLREVDHVELSVTEKGNLLVHALGKDGTHELFELTRDGSVVNAHVVGLEQPAAEATVLQHEFYLSKRELSKIAEFKQHALSDEWLQKTAPAVSRDEFSDIPARVAAGSKRKLIDYLQKNCEAPKGEAKQLAKPVHAIFETLRKSMQKDSFGEKETVGAVLSHLELPN